MPVYYPNILRYSFVRPLTWRWDRARHLVGANRNYSRRTDDEQTGKAMHYLRDLRRCHSERQLERLGSHDPDLHLARQLHEAGCNTALEVQARLLARQSVAEIAHFTSVPVSTVATYEALFFNVVDKLHARDWVTTTAIGWLKYDPAMGRSHATLLRAYAYHGGVHVLDAMLPYLLGNKLSEKPLSGATPEARLDHVIRLAIEIDTLPWDVASTQKLFKMRLQLSETSQNTASRQPKPAATAGNVDEILEAVASTALDAVPAAVQPAHDPLCNPARERIA